MKDVYYRKINFSAENIYIAIEISQVFLIKLCIDFTARSFTIVIKIRQSIGGLPFSPQSLRSQL